MTISGIDLGSVHLGLVLAADKLPLRLTAEPRTLGVDAKDLDVVVGVTVEILAQAGVARAAIEFGQFYAGDAPTPGQATAIANAWGVMKVLEHLLTRELRAAGIEAVTMTRRTWSSRLVPHHQGGISTADSNDGIRARCADGEYERLLDQHQRDAAGVLLGAWLVESERARRHHKYRDRHKDRGVPRPPELTPEERKAKRRDDVRENVRRCRNAQAAAGGRGYHRPVDATAEERRAKGCGCGHKHVRGCPVYEDRQLARILAKAKLYPL